jgi:hypothetical protein
MWHVNWRHSPRSHLQHVRSCWQPLDSLLRTECTYDIQYPVSYWNNQLDVSVQAGYFQRFFENNWTYSEKDMAKWLPLIWMYSDCYKMVLRERQSCKTQSAIRNSHSPLKIPGWSWSAPGVISIRFLMVGFIFCGAHTCWGHLLMPFYTLPFYLSVAGLATASFCSEYCSVLWGHFYGFAVLCYWSWCV